ncbi:MAG: DNA polymerase III subunit delta [Sedimentisphaerales bacterium]|nr:DNA polymerase III subunit delta [Sedimentisphaerales bacterium]
MSDSIYVIAGKDEPLVNATRQELLNRLLDPEQRMTGLLSLDGDQASIAEVLDELKTVPFLTDKRVVAVTNADGFVSKHRETLEHYFDKPSPTGVLVLTVGSWDNRTRLAKKLPTVGKLIAVAGPKRQDLPRYLVQYAQQTCGKRLEATAAELLVELAGEELALLHGEVEKLALFARDEKAITVRHVEAIVGHNRIFGAFEVIDAMVAGRIMQAVERLRNMFAEDRNAEYTVIGAFAYHLRRVFTAQALLQKGASPFEVGKKLRIWNNEERFFALLRRTSLEQIGHYIEQLAAIDHAVKTGQAKTQVALEQFVLKLAG